jgi:chitinase
MFNQNFKVMKQRIFTIVMMLALVVMAGNAFATNEKTVVAGGSYNYSLTGVKVNTVSGSSLTISYSGTGATISAVTHGGTSMSNGGALPTSTSGTVTFSVLYDLVTYSNGNIIVTVLDGGSHGCTNSIRLAITITAVPTVDLAITDVADGCQNTGAAGDGTDAVSASTGNTFGYATTITMANIPTDYSGTATITISGAASTSLTAIKINGLAAAVTGFTYTPATDLTGTLTWDENAVFTGGVASMTFNVTFTTTEGLGDVALIITASSVSVTENGGGHTYNETGAGVNSQTTSVYAMPSIGAWN